MNANSGSCRRRAAIAFFVVVFLTLTFGFLDCAFGAAEFVIAERGKPAACTIVYGKDAAPAVRYAAEELRDYVKKLTDVELPINGKAGRRIVISGDALLCDVPRDGFVVQVHPNGDLQVDGTNPRGCLYGVYDLLERFGGVGFYSSWCEKVPRLEKLSVPEKCHVEERPAFAMRWPYWYDVNVHPEFAAKLRANGNVPLAKDGTAKFGENDFRFGGGLGSCHTFNKLCDPKVYFDKHPEYFSLVKGKRLKDHTQLCLTNPDVLEIVTSNVLARIRKDPGAKFYGVSQNDWYNYCECEKCKAIDDEEESHAGTMVRFVNAVAERVEKEFPNVLIETLAYQYTRRPPKKTKLRHNVIPCLCTIECDFSRPIPESPYQEDKSFMEDIVGWAKQTDHLYLWDYVTQFPHYPHAFANVYALQGNVRFFRDNGVKMLFEQGAREGHHAGFAELKAWLLAKWMWNPEADMKTLLDEFFPGYYGAGAPFVREYFEELHQRQLKVSADPQKPLRIFDPVGPAPYDDDAFMRWADVQWAHAAEAVEKDPVFSYNVKMGRFSQRYTQLERKRAKRSDAELRNDVEAVALARCLLKDKAEARGPVQVREWDETKRIAGWKEIAKGPVVEENPQPVNVPPLVTNRAETVKFFAEHVYGKRPDLSGFKKTMKVVETVDVPALNAVRKTVELNTMTPKGEVTFRAFAFFPKAAKKASTFLYITFKDPRLSIDRTKADVNPRWPVELILKRGYATVTFWYKEVADDNAKYFDGLQREKDGWGTISTWALAASRVMDWLETEPLADASKVAVVGHSRLGKTAIWTGVTDTRFALTVSNDSGCGGAKLQHIRLPLSESIEYITRTFPHWFAPVYREESSGDPLKLPYDHHSLLAAVAPRLLAVGSAEEDAWAGPPGERAALELARPAWSDPSRTDYHVRPGPHNITPVDWTAYMDFAARHGF